MKKSVCYSEPVSDLQTNPPLCCFPSVSSWLSVGLQSDNATHFLIMPVRVNLSLSIDGIIYEQPWIPLNHIDLRY